MTKTIAYAGALATALLVASAGPAVAQSGEGLSTEGLGSSSLSSGAEGDEAGTEEEGPLGSVGELAPASVTGSLPGYTTGPIGSTAAVGCNIGTVAGWAAQAMAIPLPVPVGIVCGIVNPVARSLDSLVAGDVEGSVGEVIGGVPVVGNSLADQVDTGSATESVEGVVGDRLGSLAETSLSPEAQAPETLSPEN